jgi:hypothetical protein
LSAPREEAVPVLELVSRRRYLGYVILLLNLPLLVWNAYGFALDLSTGLQWNSSDFLANAIIIATSLAMTFILPFMIPVFKSRYWLTDDGIKISRFFRGTVNVPYSSIARAEIYVKIQREGKPSSEAMQYAKEAASQLRKGGFKFTDYTNDDTTIVLLISERRVYLLSPKYPKAFVQKLRKRVGKLPVKMVELTHMGKRIREI